MDKEKAKKGSLLGFLSFLTLIAGIILGFIEGGVIGSLMAIVLWIVGTFSFLLGLIPVGGQLIFAYVIRGVFDYLASMANLSLTSTFIFLFFLACSCLLSAFVILVIIAILVGVKV